MRSRWSLGAVLLAGAAACAGAGGSPEPAAGDSLARFEAQLDRLREELSIPGMSAIVMSHDSVVWDGAFGVADIASGRPVTPATQFHLASLTKTFASTIVLQLVEEGLVGLDDPVTDYGIRLPGPGVIRIRHLLSHTSEGTPGEAFRYNGDRFALLDRVIERATGESFAARVMARIVVPLGLDGTAPNPRDSLAFAASGRDAAAFAAAMATGYGVDRRLRPVRVDYPTSFSSAAGLVSTARDVARYAAALDGGAFLADSVRMLAYTPTRGADGRLLPYGLGWFTGTFEGHALVWHYGYWTGNSSLIIKEPSRGLTLVVLTNSDQLSARFRLGSGDLMSSTVARLFLDEFLAGPPATVVAEARRELEERGRTDQAVREGFGQGGAPDTSQLFAMMRTDSANTAWLAAHVARWGWPSVAQVGKEAVGAAFLIVQHAVHDTAFMRAMLPHIEAAHRRGDLDGGAVAMLIDRLEVKAGRPQVYGTQLSLQDGRWVLDPIADSARVDERRRRMGMPPLAEYLRLVDSVMRGP